MIRLSQIILIAIIIIGCENKNNLTKITESKSVEFNQDLANELERMAEIDQIAAYIRQGEYMKLTLEEWNSFKDSVFTTHQQRIEEIFNTYGFVGYDLAGKDGSVNFWVMVQHSNHNPEFQKEVLRVMKIEVDKGNANPNNYAYLVDRVKLNTGKKQVYGTQVTYNFNTCQAYPKNLADSTSVNERRESLGLEPIEIYLNSMSESHFEMNKDVYIEKGITKPKLYKIENN